MLNQQINCDNETIVHQLIKVQAQVTIIPHAKLGNLKIHCIDAEIKSDCNYNEFKNIYCKESETTDGKCNFTVTQIMCVQIPIAFNVDVDVKQGISCCGKPDLRPCKPSYKKY